MGNEVGVEENVERFMELLIRHCFVHELTPFVGIDEHSIAPQQFLHFSQLTSFAFAVVYYYWVHKFVFLRLQSSIGR